MVNSLVIGLYPTAATGGASFTQYLDDLTITVYDVDFNHPTTDPTPAPKHTLIGAATFNVPGHPTDTIHQLEIVPSGSPLPELAAAAAAVIELPAAIANKYLSPQSLINAVLDVERKGVQLVNHSVNYDVQIDPTVTPTTPITSLTGVTVGLYLALTDPSEPAALTAPADGSPPPYHALDAAVKAILAEDPGGATPDTTNLTPPQCLHIARELVSNRAAHPLPLPQVGISGGSPITDLANLYTSPDGAGTATDRSIFEGALLGYYTQLDGDAQRMAGYVYAWSAAQNCQQRSKNAPRAGMTLPVRLKTTADAGLQAETTLMLGN